MARIDSPRHRAKRDNTNNYDEFRETLAAPAPRTYRDDAVREHGAAAVPTDPAARAYSPVEQLVRIVVGVLNTLLALRFITALFTTNRDNTLVNVLYNATDWLVRPFQAILGAPASGGGGYFDLPALAAILVVTLVGWVISLLTRDYR